MGQLSNKTLLKKPQTGNIVGCDDTGIPLRFSSWMLSYFYNVKDYGAKGDYSTDDTIAIQTAINTCYNNGGSTVFIPLGRYKLSGALQTNINGYNYNSQLYIPINPGDGGTRTIRILGEIDAVGGTAYGIRSLGQVVTTGTQLISTLTSASGNWPAVISTAPVGGSWNYNRLVIENISIVVDAGLTTNGPCLSGINSYRGAQIAVRNCAIGINDSPYNSVLPTNEVAGIILPGAGCEQKNEVYHCYIHNFKHGVINGEHAHLKGGAIYCCQNGISLTTSGYPLNLDAACLHWCSNAFINKMITDPYGVIICNAAYLRGFVEMESFDNTPGKWYNGQPTYLLEDANNKVYGKVDFIYQITGSLSPTFTKNGGTNFTATRMY